MGVNTLRLRGHVCFISAWTSRGFESLRHTSAQAAHGQFTLGSHLKTKTPLHPLQPTNPLLGVARLNFIIISDNAGRLPRALKKLKLRSESAVWTLLKITEKIIQRNVF